MLEISRGEWQFDEPTGDIYAYDSFIGENMFIASVYSITGMPYPCSKENAKLIISAPKLLDILKRLTACKDVNDYGPIIDEARSFINSIEKK